MQYLKEASDSIHNFSIQQDEYELFKQSESIKVKGHGNGEIFVKSQDVEAKVSINFTKSTGCKVFLGKNIKGKINITFRGDDSTLYIGNGCRLNNLRIGSFQHNDFVAIGNGVTTTGKNVWISGNGAGDKNPAIIIGDDCMFSYDIVLRNSDAHPVYSLETEQQINEPQGIIHIEPHVWICEQVSILKSVTIGACSIVALGSIITKDIPRFSIVKGAPAIATVESDIYWSRDRSEAARNKAKSFIERYKNPSAPTTPCMRVRSGRFT